ncbi:MAG: NAD-dependent deacylase [Elusimicrobiota bacterium]|jgi:NAD-dependent deacetylase
MTTPNSYKKVQTLLAGAKSIGILTGAGISAESGLKTFRDSKGLWEEHRVEDVATPEGFAADPERVWRFYNARRKAADIAVPNPAHLALARLETERNYRKKMKPDGSNGNGNGTSHRAPAPVTILTQNIDGLHQQAGSLNVVELHGSIWKVRCTGCEIVLSDFPIELPILPKCEECGSLLRPHVVWFGEMLDPEVLAEAEAAVLACDLFLIIGTSSVVQPAASYPLLAAKRGVPVIEVNKEQTPITKIATFSLQGLAGEILPKITPT